MVFWGVAKEGWEGAWTGEGRRRRFTLLPPWAGSELPGRDFPGMDFMRDSVRLWIPA